MNVVVTGGGTIAPIDDVRQIANVSSGHTSATITEACLARGASVWHVHTPAALLPYARLARLDLDSEDHESELRRLSALRGRWHEVRDRLHLAPLRWGTVAEYAETLERILRENPIDVAFLAMAVSDFEPEPIDGKLGSDTETLTIRCRRAPKVIRSVRDWSPGVFLVGFKLLSRAEPEELIRQAREAGVVTRADLTVANDLQTVREGRHTVHLVHPRPGLPAETLGPGPDLAERLVGRVFEMASKRG